MRNLRRIYKLLSLLFHAALGVALTLVFTRRSQTTPSPLFDAIACWWRARIGRILGLRLEIRGRPTPGAALWVVNHISWIDIAALGGIAPVSFLSKSEVRGWPIIGWLAARGGTLFIRRGARDGADTAAEEITWHLIRGRRVVLFPEATTTRGDIVRPFHPRLFAAAIRANVPIQPIALRYRPPAGMPRHAPHPSVPFVDDDTLPAHAWRVLGEPKIEAELAFLPPQQPAVGTERRALAQAAQTEISEYLALRADAVQSGKDGASEVRT